MLFISTSCGIANTGRMVPRCVAFFIVQSQKRWRQKFRPDMKTVRLCRAHCIAESEIYSCYRLTAALYAGYLLYFV